jgi:hypothetical protein
MNPTFLHTANSSLTFFIENEFYNKGQAYKNYTSKLYYSPDPSLPNGYNSFSAPFKQWIYDQGVSGAWILNSVSGSVNLDKSETGMKVDYANGRVLIPTSYGTGINISGSYAFKDLNLYTPNETQESLLSNTKFYLNPRFGKYPNSGIAPYAMVTPAIFLTPFNYDNSQFDIGGMYETEARFSAVIMAENTWILNGALSLFADMKRKSFPEVAPSLDPINEYGDIKSLYSGNYNYNDIKNSQGGPGNLFMIKEVMGTRLSDRVKINPNIFVGIVDFDIIKVRTLE